MSMVSAGSVFSRSPLTESDLTMIDRVLAEHAERLTRTRKGRVWTYWGGGVWIDVRLEDLETVLWDCEDELLDLGLLPEPGYYRVHFVASSWGPNEYREIDELCAAVAELIGGVTTGAHHSS